MHIDIDLHSYLPLFLAVLTIISPMIFSAYTSGRNARRAVAAAGAAAIRSEELRRAIAEAGLAAATVGYSTRKRLDTIELCLNGPIRAIASDVASTKSLIHQLEHRLTLLTNEESDLTPPGK